MLTLSALELRGALKLHGLLEIPGAIVDDVTSEMTVGRLGPGDGVTVGEAIVGTGGDSDRNDEADSGVGDDEALDTTGGREDAGAVEIVLVVPGVLPPADVAEVDEA